MLRIRNLKAYYGQAQVLKSISLHVGQGEIVTLIGANGAGKTTLLNAVSGCLEGKSGEIVFREEPIGSLAPEDIVARGISHVPEGRQVFSSLTVLDNLLLGGFLRYSREGRSAFSRDLEEIYSLFPILKERAQHYAGTLSGGEQQMLAIGRALMARPRLLLLDEPSMGLAPRKVKEIFQAVATLARSGSTILLVEQNAHAAFEIASRVYLLETGRIVMEGSAADFRDDREVRRAYLGKSYREIWE